MFFVHAHFYKIYSNVHINWYTRYRVQSSCLVKATLPFVCEYIG